MCFIELWKACLEGNYNELNTSLFSPDMHGMPLTPPIVLLSEIQANLYKISPALSPIFMLFRFIYTSVRCIERLLVSNICVDQLALEEMRNYQILETQREGALCYIHIRRCQSGYCPPGRVFPSRTLSPLACSVPLENVAITFIE